MNLPPLFQGVEVEHDPLAYLRQRASEGCDAGLLAYRLTAQDLSAALVLAPEVPLSQAVAMLPVASVGLQNALGAIGPPEVAVHLGWDGTIYLNDGICGHIAITADTDVPEATPNWLIVSITLVLQPKEGEQSPPTETSLAAEGCGEIDPEQLLEAWARHTLVWIDRWESEGPRPVHAEWSGLLRGLHETTPAGTFIGTDEAFGMLLRDAEGQTTLVPLTTHLERP
ncbi:biotin/lipoate--protein ligase family protein [Jannaschia aquimarina]|uniref:BPL/LPL catalytic domain-containing protein n=1 Tax=Jannaschia aquimarina TaxID=935700 RepID=A0A0D1EDE0_9RHOB|nr:biotin/lipoate--protein ligase family protein [Jannaschia aquimarina]KIT15719.1 hypothetical protein jaqu_25960 [Jannaschia aquimarina]SNT38714.1 Biotin-(acetyl-CoA carboxylase) ligase [Jannaschia aquimarina]